MTSAGPSAPDSANVPFPPPFLYAGAVIVGYALHQRWPLFLTTALPQVREALSAALIVVGLVLMAAAMWQFLRHRTSVVPNRPTTAIAVDGPYRFSRNPMYLGLLAASLGIGVATNSWWIVVLLLPAVAVMNGFVIAREERYLERKFGRDYVAYKR